jgi:hypothetical protein
LREVERQVPSLPEYASQQPGNGQDDVAVRNGLAGDEAETAATELEPGRLSSAPR